MSVHNSCEVSDGLLCLVSNLFSQVSYGLADNRLNEYPNFFRTVPSMDTLNSARLTLLYHFQWYRIGILGSSQKVYNYVSFISPTTNIHHYNVIVVTIM